MEEREENEREIAKTVAVGVRMIVGVVIVPRMMIVGVGMCVCGGCALTRMDDTEKGDIQE